MKRLLNKIDLRWLNTKTFVEIIRSLLVLLVSIVGLLKATTSLPLQGLYQLYNGWFVIVLVVLIIIVFTSLELYKINDFRKENWTKCPKFPNKDRMCCAIEEHISSTQLEKKENDEWLYVTNNEEHSNYTFIGMVASFVSYARDELLMTLPKNPYDQRTDPKAYRELQRAIKMIESRPLIKNNNRNKIIVLSEEALRSFRLKLIEDIWQTISNNSSATSTTPKKSVFSWTCFWPIKAKNKKSTSIFEEYLNLHKDLLFLWWDTKKEKSGEEFIIIDKTVCLTLGKPNSAAPNSKNAEIRLTFSPSEIDKKKRPFEGLLKLKSLYTTKDFLEDNVMNNLEETFIEYEKRKHVGIDKDKVKTYLVTMLANMQV